MDINPAVSRRFARGGVVNAAATLRLFFGPFVLDEWIDRATIIMQSDAAIALGTPVLIEMRLFNDQPTTAAAFTAGGRSVIDPEAGMNWALQLSAFGGFEFPLHLRLQPTERWFGVQFSTTDADADVVINMFLGVGVSGK